MIKFKQFTNLLEAVKKSDINKALADTKFRIGAEFEYFDDNLNEGGGYTEYPNAEQEFRDLQSDMDSAVSNRENESDELYRETQAEQEEKVGDLNDEITDLEEKRDEVENDFDERIGEAEQQLSLVDDEGESLGTSVAELEQEKDEVIGTMQADIDELINTRDDLENLDVQEYYEEEHGSDYYDELSERQDGHFPNVDYYDELIGFWLHEAGHRRSDIDQAIFDYVYEENDSTWYDLGAPESNGGDYDDDNFTDRVENSMKLDDLARITGESNPYIGRYHGGEDDYSRWRIEEDSSLEDGNNGVEIISKIMTLKEGLTVIPAMFKYIGGNGHTNSETGFHITLSVKGTVLKDKIDLMKLVLFMDEGYIFKHMPDREGNHYAQAMLQQVGQNIDYLKDRDDSSISDIKKIKFRDMKKFFEKFVAYLPRAAKFNAINWSDLTTGEGRIEMRWAGGRDYHKKWPIIKALIGRYVHYMKLALDEDYMAKEYAQKLMRLLQHGQKDSNKLDKIQQRQIEKELTFLNKSGKFIGWMRQGSKLGAVKVHLFFEYKNLVYRVHSTQRVTQGPLLKKMQWPEYTVIGKLKLSQWIKNFKGNKYRNFSLDDEYTVE